MMVHELELKLEAEKVIYHRFGYSEVYLKLNGEKSKYKLILKNGKLVAIVKRGYKLIPHELIDETLRGLVSLKVVKRWEEVGRCFWICSVNGRQDVEIWIENSVDRTLSLGVRLVLVFDGLKVPIVLPKRRMAMSLRKVHKKSASIHDLPKLIDSMLEDADRIKWFMNTAFEKKAVEYLSVWELLKEEIPEKYTKSILAKLQAKVDDLTVGHVYKELAQKILSSPKTSTLTKMQFLKSLNEVLWIIAEVEST